MTDKLHCLYCSDEMIFERGTLTGIKRCVCRNPNCKYDGYHFPVEVIRHIIDGKKARDALKIGISALGLVGNGKGDEQGLCRFVDENNCESVRTICRNALDKIETITKPRTK